MLIMEVSLMNIAEKCLACYYSEYKKSRLAQTQTMKLFVYPSFLEGTGFPCYDGELSDEVTSFMITFDEIKNVLLIDIKGDEGINIIYQPKNSIVNTKGKSIIIIGVNQYNEAMNLVKDTRHKYNEKIRVQLENKKQKKQEKQEWLLKIAEEEESAKQFLQECYNYHITTNDNPYFELFKDNLQIALIYIDKDRNLNFLRIDGTNNDESNGIIPYSQIHYFEKVGTIHYTTDINCKYSSFGGSITGSTFSKEAAFWGGLLFGPMGMIAGALFSYEPARIEMPTTQFNIESDVMRIDDRNVILNYYSGTHKQYIDIEVPAGIYNFLQTYLPEKKYDIVMELEKKSVVHKATKEIEKDTYSNSITSNKASDESETNQSKDVMTTFKQKIDKLKLIHDSGILTEAEYDVEKKKLLELL